MPLTGTVNAANARIDLFVDYTTEAGTQTFATMIRHVGSLTAPGEYVRGLFGTTLLGEQAYVSDHEAPLDAQVWYTVASGPDNVALTAGPFTIPSNGYVWMKDPGRPWADLRLDLCLTPDDGKDPCVSTSLVQDTFSRTVADGWGTADTGQTWTNSGGAASDFDVAAGVGTHTHTAVNTIHRSVITATTPDQDVVTTVAVDKLAAGDSFFTGPVVRHADSNNYYWARGTFTATGTVQLALRKRVAGTETGIGSVITLPFGYTAGQQFGIRLRVRGALIEARMWPASVTESEEWDVQVSDTSLAAAGSVGVRSLIGAVSTATLPVVFSFDNFTYTDPSAAAADDVAWVGFRDKVREADAGLFPVLDRERPADVYARRKDITTGALFLTRSRGAIDLVYELYTAGGPLMFQVPAVYHMNAPTIQRDRYYQPDALNEGYISQDQRRPIRLWTVPLTAVDFPVGEPQGTDTANWCALMDTYGTYADLTATGYNWGQVATGQATAPPLVGLYGGGTYGGGIYGG